MQKLFSATAPLELPPAAPSTPPEATAWKIYIHCHGVFDFYGTELDADTHREKLTIEKLGCQGGLVWRADLARESDRLSALDAQYQEARQGVPAAIWLGRVAAEKRERAVIGFVP